jgi:fibronectin type 3 domain-containing protein
LVSSAGTAKIVVQNQYSGIQSNSATLTVVVPSVAVPAAPTGMTAVAGNGQASLTWNASTGATSYNVKRATTSGGPYTAIAAGMTSTSYADSSLTNGATYYYVVSAVNSGGESANSAQASATPQAPVTIPAAPAGMTAVAGNAQASLAWNASTGATSYNVKRATTSGGLYTAIATGLTSTSYVNSSLTNGTTYYYVVSAVNSAGESANSTQASATPQAPVTIPAAPTGMTAVAGNAQASLAWNASTGATSYNVKRATTSGGPYTAIATGLTSTSYVNSSLTNGTTYYYVVSAVNSAGESANSTPANATPQAPGTVPAAPTNPTALAGNAQVSLAWNASTGATSYNVKRATTSGGPYATLATGVTSTTYVNSSLTNGTTYYYVVSAVNSTGESANSSQASATPQAPVTAPTAPTGLTANGGNAQVSLAWNASSSATSYNVKRATTSGGAYANIATGMTATGYSDTSITNGTTYYYVVSAVNSTGESANSNQASATPSSATAVYDVTKYGATGNGSTDDTNAIKSAISALTGGGELYFPCGTYLISSGLTIVKSNVTIAGATGCATIKGTGSGYTALQIGSQSLSSAVPLSAVSNELSTTFSSSLALAAGDYVLLQEGGQDYSTDTAPGHPTNCDVSGCRGEMLAIQSVSGTTATVTTALHYTYDPGTNAANVSKLTSPTTGVTVHDLGFDGSGTLGTGLYMAGVVNSTVSNVTATSFVNSGLLSYYAFNLAWNNVTITQAGSGGADGFLLVGQGRPSVNGANLSNLNAGGFGMGLHTVADGTFGNITVDKTGTTSGRPFKLAAASYNTFNSLTVKNGSGTNGYNGMSVEYYSSHNTFNSCVVTNNSGHGIDGFGNYNQYNKFVNCTVSANSTWQLGQTRSALGNFNDTNWEISGGTYTGVSGQNVLQINGANTSVHNSSINGPGNVGVNMGANNGCVNNNAFSGSLAYTIYLSGTNDLANGITGSGAIYPNPLPTGTCQ